MLFKYMLRKYSKYYTRISSQIQAMAYSSRKMEKTSFKLDISQGAVVGIKGQLPNGKPLYSFKGIPYAKPPIGELRFAAPVPLPKFDESTLDCSRERDVCYHKDLITMQTIGSENCLFLNVYTPQVDEKSDLPVMVWIHGGAFSSGSGNSDYFSPEYLVEQNVIVVTINYRLSVLGFLCLPEAGIYGNAGLKDQRLAMEWIQQNISMFGGNPNNVTLFGESAGAACVHIHTLSKASQKLFHKAICQSGSAVHEWTMQSNAEEKSKLLAQKLGCTETDSTKIAHFLKSITDLPTLFSHYFSVLTVDERRRGLPIVFKPTVEQESDEAIITKPPLELMCDRENNTSIPIMMGYNSKEGLIMLSDAQKHNKLPTFNEDFARFIPKSLNISENDVRCATLVKEMRSRYLNDQRISIETVDQFSDLLTDYHFAIGSHLAAELHAKYQESPMYFYRFSIDEELNLFKKLTLMALGISDTKKIKGACHADEIYYLFRCKIIPVDLKDHPIAEQLLRSTCNLWTNFAKNSDPSPGGTNPIRWEPVEKTVRTSDVFNLKYLEIDNDKIEMKTNPDSDRIAFWRNMYKKFNDGLTKAKL